jgi:hypothetical protein
MKTGLEDKKKVVVLGVLLAAAGYFFYDNVLSGPSSSGPSPAPVASAPRPDPTDVAAVAPETQAPQSTQPRPLLRNRNQKGDEFHPVLRPKGVRPEDQPKLDDIDPTLHLELLTKVQDLKPEGGQRNLFQFGAAQPVTELKGEEPKVFAMGRPVIFPKPEPPKVAELPKPEPQFTPPTFKYYGLATKRIDNKKTAFFLEGEEIIFATEGMTVKTRWRVVRIGVDSVMLEDIQNKKQQAMVISEDTGGGNS